LLAAVLAPFGCESSGTRDGGADCGCGAFAEYRICCGGRCVNHKNDPANCNGCGVQCPSATPFCDNGTCAVAPCDADAGTTCAGGACCGTSCCAAGQICCGVEGPIARELVCHTPTADIPSCPAGCAPLCISDRDRKRAIAPADPQAVLAGVARLPISTWRYREEPEGVQHLGPMAQDFRATFGLGDDDRTYHAVDAHGVSLAAIQALARMIEKDEQRIHDLQRENRALARRLRALESRAKSGATAP
jgi:hypothetical protein